MGIRMTTTVHSQLRFPGEVGSGHAVELLDDRVIAEFASLDAAQTSDGELLRIIRSARLPLTKDVDEHLEFRDRPTLVRLAHLARRCCHNRKSAMPMDHPVDEEGA
jgi:hypothetical protein